MDGLLKKKPKYVMNSGHINIVTIIEFLLIGFIVYMQTKRALKTTRKIEQLEDIVPKEGFFKIFEYAIPIIDLQNNPPVTILKGLKKYKSQETVNETEIDDENHDFSEDEDRNTLIENKVSLINPENSTNPVFDKILSAINVYLLKNKGATADFNLIKDITERNVDMEDEDISQTVTIPLYLGLMGTILGIIFGLVNFLIASSSGNDFEIQGFLLGVSIAMFASVYGLFWTVKNSNFKHKTARKIVEECKNDFYTFIQTELLPVLNQNISSSVHKLHSNLVQFNSDFTQNISHLSGLLGKNYDAIKMQDQILQNLENIDITSFAKANVTILTELKETTKDLSKFNEYVNILNSSVAGTTKLSGYFLALLEKTDYFQGLAEKLDDRVELSNRLVEFLNDHYQVLNKHGVILNDSVKSVDDILIKSLDELQSHTRTKIKAIKEITEREEDLMTKSFAENRSQLSNLSLLNNLTENSIALRNETSSKLDRNEQVLGAILKELQTSNRRAENGFFNRIGKWFKRNV